MPGKNSIVLFLQSLGILPFFIILFCAGCALAPQWRVFQKKVPPPVHQDIVTEAQRQAADVIARNPEIPFYLRATTQALSQSLGMPIKPLIFKTPLMEAEEANKVLREDIVRLRKLVAKQSAWLRENAGKELEGTGFNLFGATSFLGIAGTVALFVACPGALSIAFFVIRRLRATVRTISEGVENFSVDNPEKARELKEDYLDGAMDSAHKKIVAREQRFISRKYIEKRTKEKLATV